MYNDELRKKLVHLNELYRKGVPEISDIEFDGLVSELYELDPNDEFFKSGVPPVAILDRMQELPIPMFSLEKIKEVKKFRGWVNEVFSEGAKKLVFMPKYDGISLLVDEVSHNCWTRGDGVNGQRSDKHYKKMSNGSNNLKQNFIYSWGEALFCDEDFTRLKNEDTTFPYKTNRNAVAGIFNSPKGYSSKFLHCVRFVRYGSSMEKDKIDQIKEMNRLYENSSDYIDVEISDLLQYSDDELLSTLNEMYYEFKKTYPIDGIVIEVNELKVQASLGRLPNNNPRYAIAFKRDEWLEVFRAKVIDIELGVGKTGVITPVIIIDPIIINGVTVRRCTSHNVSVLIENHISIGAEIEIIRGGEVIPKFIRTVNYNVSEYKRLVDKLDRCPSCKSSATYSESGVDLICTNKLCPERVISQMTFFFRTMGCEEFDEPSIRKLYFLGCISIENIVQSTKEELQIYLGSSKGDIVYTQIRRVCDGASLARFMSAMNWFEGVLAETTCQKILDGVDDATLSIIENKEPVNTNQDVFISNLEKINGIGKITALAFLRGYNLYCEYNVPFYKITHIKTLLTDTVANPNRLYVCLTGFRDKELVSQLIRLGHVALNDVTKECNLLVVADINSTSSKVKTAQKRGIKIITKEDLTHEILV